MTGTYFQRLESLYDKLCIRFPGSVSALGWYSQKTQHKRFEMFLKLGDFQGKRVLDVGCGHGDFYGFLKKQGMEVDYTGIDLSANMIEVATQKYPKATFQKQNLFEINAPFDWVVASGILAYVHGDTWAYIRLVIQKMLSLANAGIALNALSSATPDDERMPAFFYVDPARFLREGEALAHRSEIDQNYLPNDVTLRLLKH